MTYAPERCLLLVVDVQNDFCHEDGATARLGHDVSAAQAIAAPIESLAEAARRNDVPVVFVSTTHGVWYDTPGWVSRGSGGTTLDVRREPICADGSWGAELYGVRPRPGDLELAKHRYSAFAYTPLELVFAARGRDTVLLAGTRTNVCVEHTAMDALVRGLHPVLVRECVAAAGDALQAAALDEFADHIGTVASAADVQRAWSEQPQEVA